MNTYLQEILLQKSKFVAKETDEELLLIPIKDNVADFNQYLILNAVAAFIWEHIEPGINETQLKSKIQEVFEVSAAQIDADLPVFIAQLHQYTCQS